MRSLLLASFSLATALAGSGCVVAVDNDDGIIVPARGDLSVAWTFDGGFIDCEDIVDIDIVLVDPDGFVYDESTYSCDLAAVVYEEVDEGWWSIEMDGVDGFGRVIYEGNADLFVNGNAFNEFDIDLALR